MTVARATVNVDVLDTFDIFKQAHGMSDEVATQKLSFKKQPDWPQNCFESS